MKNSHLLSVTEFKQILKEQDQKELIQLIVDCYKDNKQMQEYIAAKYGTKAVMEEILDNYKDKIYMVFFPKNMKSPFKLADAKKAISDFKKVCNDSELQVDLMLYYVEMGVDFTNTYGDINDAFYESVEKMYGSVIKLINKQKDKKMFELFHDRLKTVLEQTEHIGWGFNDTLSELYLEIKWFGAEHAAYLYEGDTTVKRIKQYIIERLKHRAEILALVNEDGVAELVSNVINVDEFFIEMMIKTDSDYSNQQEFQYVADHTQISQEVVEVILWQRDCFEMENNQWVVEGICKQCSSNQLYRREVPNEDFADRVVCNVCQSEQ